SGLAGDGTTGKGGIFRIAQLANQALLVSDRTNDIVNVNTSSKRTEFVNGTILRLYTDAYTTRSVEIGTNGTIATQQSTTAVAIASNGTIATNVGVSRLNPAANVTGCIMTAGTIPGQHCWVVNESPNTITFASSGSNVADGATVAIPANAARIFLWN